MDAEDVVMFVPSALVSVSCFGVVFLVAANPTGIWTPVAVLVASAILGLLVARSLA